MSKMKAIQTHYNGYHFRSRLEARWAVFFDAVKIEYEYEHEGFELEDGTFYLPDFWLPNLKIWAEVKGKSLTEIEVQKAASLPNACALLDHTPSAYRSAVFVAGTPDHGWDNYLQWQANEDVDFCFMAWCNVIDTDGGDTISAWRKAAKAARSARFEHGETPNNGKDLW